MSLLKVWREINKELEKKHLADGHACYHAPEQYSYPVPPHKDGVRHRFYNAGIDALVRAITEHDKLYHNDFKVFIELNDIKNIADKLKEYE